MKLKFLFLIMFCFALAGLSSGFSAIAQVPPEQAAPAAQAPEFREKYYVNGNLMYQGTFRDDVPVGEMKRFNENGILQAILDYDEDGKSVRAVLFYEDGSRAAEGLYSDMQKDSVWRYYSYYDRGLAAEETYSKGMLNGPLRTYYDNGRVSEVVEWLDGERNGIWEQYFESGRPRLRAHYQNDMLEGEYIVYHENGNLSVEGSYSAGRRHGLWSFHNEDGEVATELHYEHGRNLDPDVTDEMQDDLFRRIDENMGKFEEPDETEFLMPPNR